MKYMDVFKPFLLQTMNNVAEVEVSTAFLLITAPV